MSGDPVVLRLKGSLTASRGRLLENSHFGVPVHAGSHLRKREIAMEEALLKSPPEFERILAHELFHFVWLRLGNPVRRSFEALLAGELKRGARGELGWSAELRKAALNERDAASRSRRWRDYVCESFCDTAAWVYAPPKQHPEHTLARRWRDRRRSWFLQLAGRPLKV